ncbi:MAG: NYN domain-containing protein [Actinomycetales bacterium]|nr:NYN domain-containing protein [Actinomycetales bacterium]
MAERLIVYVDGFNLYHGLHDSARCRWLWLDLVALATSLRPRSALQQVRYFTAPVLGQPDAQSRQQHYLDALVAHNGARIDIVQGRYQSKTKTCRTCGAQWVEREEKETDVNIAVGLVTDTARGAMDAALLLSADSDLAPAVRAAKGINPSLFVAAAFPPKRYSAELKALMPASFQISPSKVRGSFLPETSKRQAAHSIVRRSGARRGAVPAPRQTGPKSAFLRRAVVTDGQLAIGMRIISRSTSSGSRRMTRGPLR